MGEISDLFKKYQDNIEWLSNLSSTLSKPMEYNTWESVYMDSLQEYAKRYHENDEYLKDIFGLLRPNMTDAEYLELFEAANNMYQSGFDNPFIIINVLEFILPYFEEKNDLNTIVKAHSYCFYEQNDIIGTFYGVEKRDLSHGFKLLKYKNQYELLTDSLARYRFWITYHNLIISGIDKRSLPLEKCYDYYFEMMELWNSDIVKELGDFDNPQFIHVIDMIQQKILISERYILQSSEYYQTEFCKLADKKHEEFLAKNEPIFYMDIISVVSYLRANQIRNISTIEENFEQLYKIYSEYIASKTIDNKLQYEDFFVIFHITITLIMWSQEFKSKEQASQKLHELISISEARFKEQKYALSVRVDEILLEFLHTILKTDMEKEELERYIYEFGIKRQLSSYTHTVIVKNICMKFANVLITQYQSVLLDFPIQDNTAFSEYIEHASTIFDAGCIDQHIRRYFKANSDIDYQKSILDNHTNHGVSLLKNKPGFEPYLDIIQYHHVYYDGSNVSQEEFQGYSASKYKLAIDMLVIANAIDEATNPLLNGGLNNRPYEDWSESIFSSSGTKFNPELIAILKNSPELLDYIKTNTNQERTSIIYSTYQSFDIGATKEEQSAHVDRIFNQLREYKTEDDLEECLSEIDKLNKMAEQYQSSHLVGLVHFLYAFYFYYKKDNTNAKNKASLALQYLYETDEYERIARLNEMLGIYALFEGDYSLAINYFLNVITFCEKCGIEKGIYSAYFNIAFTFRMVGNYVKSLEYLHKCAPGFKDELVNQAMLLCYQYLCSSECQIESETKRLSQELLDFEKQYKNLEQFPDFTIHIFIARMYYDQNNNDKALELLKKIEDDSAFKAPFIDNIDENLMYLSLLRNYNQYEKIIAHVDKHIHDGIGVKENYYLQKRLIEQAMDAASELNNFDLLKKYQKQLLEISNQEITHTAELTLLAEKNTLDNISTLEKHRILQKDNSLLQKNVEEANSANNAKSTFLSSMSHEIRTPIHAVLGLDEMILRESKEEQIKKYALDIQNAGKTLLGLINDILDFSKLESGKLELISEEYSIKELTRELINMLEPRAIEKKLKFIVKLSPNCPSKLMGDDLRIKQIILNLLTNAIKYTEKGNVILHINCEKIDDNTSDLHITVSDTGIGMRPEDLAKLSQAFVRLDEKKNRTIEGTGLGMSIVTNLLKQMNSKLNVQSTYGVGSTFSFHLKQSVVDWTYCGDLNENNNLQKTTVEGPLFTAPNATIMVVDDTKVNLTVIKGLLRRTKVQLELVPSGIKCLELCKEKHYDLILMDHRMPEMDGVEALHRLQIEENLNKTTPVIALTANAISGAYDYYTKEGFIDLLIKPVNANLLEEKIKQYLPSELLETDH